MDKRGLTSLLGLEDHRWVFHGQKILKGLPHIEDPERDKRPRMDLLWTEDP